MGEANKACARRIEEGWFERYCPADKPGIDIGCQHDSIHDQFRKWDLIFDDGDATFMEGVTDETYHTVYAGHVLEHLDDPVTGLKNWYRILKPGGHLIVNVPHRDLYEKKKELPSSWNVEHKTFWLPEEEDLPHTLNLKETVLKAIRSANIVSLEVLDQNYERNGEAHSIGEYSIEIIVKKL